MARFKVEGPFEVPVTKGAGGRRIGRHDAAEFWDEHDELGDECGCYVFGIRAGKGYTPIYVGKATKSFRQEVFAAHKLSAHYNEALVHIARGTPIVFLVAIDKTKGKTPTKQIDNLETFLIQTGVSKNSELSNVHKTSTAQWELAGIVRSKGRGNSTKASREFKRLMGLR